MRRDPAYPDVAPVWGAPSMPLTACHTPRVSVWPDSPLAQLQAPQASCPQLLLTGVGWALHLLCTLPEAALPQDTPLGAEATALHFDGKGTRLHQVEASKLPRQPGSVGATPRDPMTGQEAQGQH